MRTWIVTAQPGRFRKKRKQALFCPFRHRNRGGGARFTAVPAGQISNFQMPPLEIPAFFPFNAGSKSCQQYIDGSVCAPRWRHRIFRRSQFRSLELAFRWEKMPAYKQRDAREHPWVVECPLLPLVARCGPWQAPGPAQVGRSAAIFAHPLTSSLLAGSSWMAASHREET